MKKDRFLGLTPTGLVFLVIVALVSLGCTGVLYAAPVTIQFWHARGSPASIGQYFQDYEKLHPGVIIKQTVYVDDDYKTQYGRSYRRS